MCFKFVYEDLKIIYYNIDVVYPRISLLVFVLRVVLFC